MVGFDEEFMNIKDRLTGSQSKLDIISIVGMGGIGKTTLARKVYDDSLIDYHFDVRLWITVSQDYNVKNILTGLLKTNKQVKGELHRMRTDQLEEKLYKSLKGQRYLIVMDDVWDNDAWDCVRRLYPDDNNGSRIILTTRLTEVAIYANSFNSIHHLSLLNMRQSWDLLREKVFGEEVCPLELEQIGMKIANSCKGLPLAILVVGGLLSKVNRTRHSWGFIARGTKSLIPSNDDQISEILSLSYNHLPHHLRACFLYMGVFPEDYEISVSRLIKLWVAEGFLKPNSLKSLEEVAEEYLKDLIDRNLIMVHKRNFLGETKTCIIHDLLRELCIKKASDENFLMVLNHDFHVVPVIGDNERRVSIHSNTFRIGTHESRIRSFLYFSNYSADSLSLSFVRFRQLEVMHLGVTFFEFFLVQIVELVNLRYLALTCLSTYKFPASIVKLQNLQTLIICQDVIDSDHFLIFDLPFEIWEMPQLRHLLFEKKLLSRLSVKRINPCILEHLLTLSKVGNLVCRKEVLESMPVDFPKRSQYTPFNAKFYALNHPIVLKLCHRFHLFYPRD